MKEIGHAATYGDIGSATTGNGTSALYMSAWFSNSESDWRKKFRLPLFLSVNMAMFAAGYMIAKTNAKNQKIY
jgi:hypothetical protein